MKNRNDLLVYYWILGFSVEFNLDFVQHNKYSED